MSGCETTWQSLPYGDGLTSSGNCSDTSELHFTGKERDEESGNDYFPARYYSSPLGRWMSPDSYMGSYDPSNPQTFNRYSYVLNDPLAYADPSGQDPVTFSITAFCEGASGACAASLLNPVSIAIVGGLAAVAELGHIFGWWGSQFHGSLKPRPKTPSSNCSVSSTSIDQYIAKAKPSSPLIGQGSNFMAVGLKYNLDPRLFVSLAGAETTFGTAITAGKFNALNVMYNGYNSNFSSFQSNINAAGKSLTNPANGYDLTNTSTMYSTYCSGSGCATGLKNLNTFMRQQGANINSLHDPCGHQE